MPVAPDAFTRTLDLPGVTLTYDVRPGPGRGEPPLMLIGTPMAAQSFADLAATFPDRTIVAYDPRGSERSRKVDPATPNLPADHAEDLHRVIEAVGGPVDLFASSGGAVAALALVARHPDDVRTLVAHEPPIAAVLPDAEHARAAVRAVGETYQRSGFGAGMAHFIAVTGHRGPFTAEVAAMPGPDPQQFGMPAADDGTRDDPLLSQNLIGVTHFEPDVEALLAAPTRIVLAGGEESVDQMANRGAHAVAALLGTEVVVFPSHHGGFVGGDGPWAGKPVEFGARLREVLDGGGR